MLLCTDVLSGRPTSPAYSTSQHKSKLSSFFPSSDALLSQGLQGAWRS